MFSQKSCVPRPFFPKVIFPKHVFSMTVLPTFLTEKMSGNMSDENVGKTCQEVQAKNGQEAPANLFKEPIQIS